MNSQDQTPKLGAEHQRLAVFVGQWHAEGDSYGEGQSKENPYGSAVQWTSEETYEWLEGGFFLVHRWDAYTGEHPFNGIELIGYDAASGEYYSNLFDNNGYHPIYRIQVSNDTWTFTGEAQRATVVVSDGGNTMTFRWEWKNDGLTWLPLCDRKATRIK